MGHCSLGKSVCLSWTVGWDTVDWVRVPLLAQLLSGGGGVGAGGGTPKPGLECPP